MCLMGHNETEKKPLKPFLKWAGGKTQLLRHFETMYPEDLGRGHIKRYIEPFVGSGAVFFHIADRYPVKNFTIMDRNDDLILAYKVIRRDPAVLMDFLSRYSREYFRLHEKERKEYFYEMRLSFNLGRFNINYTKFNENWVSRAAQLMFLNKTCYNGLYRVNRKGEFNVPYGRYRKPMFFNEENILNVSKILAKTNIISGDFALCLKKAEEHTFTYFDPPYRPISTTSYFTSYSKGEFDDAEQSRLAETFREIDRKGGHVMLSNSDPANYNPDDRFFEELYREFNIVSIPASRSINSNPGKRGKISELVITNYRVKGE